jgi:peroxiredoxin
MGSRRPVWVLFDEVDQRSPAPYFRLASVMGRPVTRNDYRGLDNLVLFFGHAVDCPGCQNVLREFTAHLREYNQNEAVTLAIFPDLFVRENGLAVFQETPFPVLSDPGGEVRKRYTALMAHNLVSDQDNLIFVLDQYGGPYAALIGEELDEPDLQKEVLEWLEYISLKCPE